LFHQFDRVERVLNIGGTLVVLPDTDDDGGTRVESHIVTL
jgi:hypothetical protein